jgi:LysR family transcriptional regulator, glycine cleavage system transcriptional activator
VKIKSDLKGKNSVRRPTLSALRAFEATARLGSMRKAALELQIDHAVVSRHIKSVEAELGVNLISRKSNSFELSEIGKFLSTKSSAAFLQLDEAVAQTRQAAHNKVLRVSCVHGLAQRWLMPRLDDFCSRYPAIEVRLRAMDETESAGQNDADIEIKYVANESIGESGSVLAQPDLFPVVAKALYQSLLQQGCTKLEDFLHSAPLLHEIDDGQWLRWIHAVFGTPLNTKKGAVFSNANLAIEAAALGKGIAIANDLLLEDKNLGGKLVRLSNQPVKLSSYVLRLQETQGKSKSQRLFRDWLISNFKFR